MGLSTFKICGIGSVFSEKELQDKMYSAVTVKRFYGF